jgi:Skp family chaperone for outer membrane proteins
MNDYRDSTRLILHAALRHVPDGIERASAVFAVDVLFNEVAALREENADLKCRVARAQASLTEIRTDLEAQMEFWKPDGDKT